MDELSKNEKKIKALNVPKIASVLKNLTFLSLLPILLYYAVNHYSQQKGKKNHEVKLTRVASTVYKSDLKLLIN